MNVHVHESLTTAVLFLVAGAVGEGVLFTLRRRPRETLTRLVASVSTGLLIGVAIFSGAKTGLSSPVGITVVLALALSRAPPTSRILRSLLPGLLLSALGSALFAFWLGHWFHDPDGTIIRGAFQRDSSHYVVLTRFISEKGIETPGPNWLDPAASTYSPYHYVDIWLGALVHQLSRLDELSSYIVVGQTIWASLCLLSIAALVRRLSRSGIPAALASSALAMSPLVYVAAELIGHQATALGLEKILGGLSQYAMSVVLVNKFVPGVVVVASAILAATFRKTRVLSWWLWGALPLIYVTFAPLAAGVLAAVAVRALFQHRWVVVRSLAVMGAAVLAALVLPLLLHRTGATGFFMHRPSPATPTSELIRGAINVLGGGSIRVLALSVVTGVVLFATQRRRKQWLSLGVPLAVGLVASLLGWAAAYRSIDSWQLTTIANSTTFTLVFASCIGLLLARLRHRSARAAVVVALGLIAIAFVQKGLSENAGAVSISEFTRQCRSLRGHKEGPVLWLRNGASFREVWDFNLGASIPNEAALLDAAPAVVTVPIGHLVIENGVIGERESKLLARAPFFVTTGRSSEVDVSAEDVAPYLDSAHGMTAAFLDAALVESFAPRLGRCVTDPSTGNAFCELRGGGHD